MNKFPLFIIAFVLNLVLVVFVFIGIRGSIGTFPLREHEAHISSNPLINHIATNPLIALSWAIKHYKEQDKFYPVNLSDLQALEKELFPIFRTNSQKYITKQPNVVAVLMESFASNILTLDDEQDFDLLMNFRSHFQNGKRAMSSKQPRTDFTFMNFLSGKNGTASSFASLFLLSPSAQISLSSMNNKKIALTPFDVYKKAGYEVVYITSGNRSWQNLGDYVITQGADAVYDSNFLLKHYPQSKDFTNVYGILDEFAYKFAFEFLQRAEKPTFIVILTTTNHPPQPPLPKNFTPPHYDLESKMSFFRLNDKKKILTSVQTFSYASNAFGDFIQSIKNSSLKNNTIIAASGDHYFRDLNVYENVALNHGTPLYMYIPSVIVGDFQNRAFSFEPEKFGSHKDIFPTLYALSLNEYEFLSLGGRNLFDTKSDERYNFAYNDSVFIDENGIYPRGANLGYTLKKGILSNDKDKQSIEIPAHKAHFFEKIDRLDNLQLNFRIFGFENSNF